MRVTLLGTGTSTGVPVPACGCGVCTSKKPKNERLRPSILVELSESDALTNGGDEIISRIVVDTGADFREQALRSAISRIDAVFYTHTHADHIFGLDDLRCFNFVSKQAIPLYGSKRSCQLLKRFFEYAFVEDEEYEGGAPPKLSLNPIDAYVPLDLFGTEIIPLPIMHGSTEIFGYRFGNFAYLTDCSKIPNKTRGYLEGLDLLILDGLRTRPHKTHFTHEQSVSEVEKLRPQKTYLTHISHEIDHDFANESLKKMTDLDVELAYDGLILEL